ncbi:MAG: helix-turn-helix transcriptional regulator [Lachnospiraceae bacterium]|nr:helix-turn-helix transcriptional regulator [Lachnospiraceae bacterium]
MIKYDKLFKTLKENGISQYRLYKYYGISRSQIQRLKNNQSVTTHTLNMILNILGEGFTLNDIAEFIPDTEETKDLTP